MAEIQELKNIRGLTQFKDELIEHRELARVNVKNQSYPIIGFSIGSKDPSAPCLGLFGGVHGLERVGTHVVTNYLASLFNQIKWDMDLRDILTRSRIVSIPLINPAGMANRHRCNPNGVDLMRNSPVVADRSKTTFLVSGHRLSKYLPWYQGEKNQKMELEAQTLFDFVAEKMFASRTSLAIDFHSGFGIKDRLWYPWAKGHEEFPHIKQVQNLTELFDETLPFHVYKIEAQSASYTIEGDLWDHMCIEQQKQDQQKGNLFIPWTLEMGSWSWVKKNPTQLFSSGGLFNPVKEHRYDRTMRRHLSLIDMFFRAVRNGEAWS